jgi:hypothetical protein
MPIPKDIAPAEAVPGRDPARRLRALGRDATGCDSLCPWVHRMGCLGTQFNVRSRGESMQRSTVRFRWSEGVSSWPPTDQV